jgi:hypothetical protein
MGHHTSKELVKSVLLNKDLVKYIFGLLRDSEALFSMRLVCKLWHQCLVDMGILKRAKILQNRWKFIKSAVYPWKIVSISASKGKLCYMLYNRDYVEAYGPLREGYCRHERIKQYVRKCNVLFKEIKTQFIREYLNFAEKYRLEYCWVARSGEYRIWIEKLTHANEMKWSAYD